jgi:hypothetical protein
VFIVLFLAARIVSLLVRLRERDRGQIRILNVLRSSKWMKEMSSRWNVKFILVFL